MITEKQDAIKEVNKSNVDFDQIDKKWLMDKDVARAYMQHHSSNDLLYSKFPIDIDVKGMIDDADFILDVIKNLDVGYNKDSLMSLIKYSTSRIVKRKIDIENIEDEQELKQYITQLMTDFNSMVKLREEELTKKQSLLNELSDFIEQTELDCFKNTTKSKSHEKYKRCNIGFTAEL